MKAENTSSLRIVTTPPKFCEYAGGQCDQYFLDTPGSKALFLYPSQPETIASTIEEAVNALRNTTGNPNWLTWKDLGVSGRIIFCQVCKAIRFTDLAVVDITTLNFNLLFEIGYAIGLGKPVLPIRDTNYIKDNKVF